MLDWTGHGHGDNLSITVLLGCLIPYPMYDVTDSEIRISDSSEVMMLALVTVFVLILVLTGNEMK